MAGALAERVFALKVEKAGFVGFEVLERRPFRLEDVADYPLFTPDLIATMRELLSPEQQREVAVAVTVRTRRPSEADDVRD